MPASEAVERAAKAYAAVDGDLPSEFALRAALDAAFTTLQQRLAEVERENRLLRKVEAEAADAIDVADSIIGLNLGTDTPKEWDRAFRRVQKARSALSKEAGQQSPDQTVEKGE